LVLDFAPELTRIGSKPLAQLAFAPGVSHTIYDYIAAKVRNARALRQKYLPQLRTIGNELEAHRFPYHFYFSRVLDIEEERHRLQRRFNAIGTWMPCCRRNRTKSIEAGSRLNPSQTIRLCATSESSQKSICHGVERSVLSIQAIQGSLWGSDPTGRKVSAATGRECGRCCFNRRRFLCSSQLTKGGERDFHLWLLRSVFFIYLCPDG